VLQLQGVRCEVLIRRFVICKVLPPSFFFQGASLGSLAPVISIQRFLLSTSGREVFLFFFALVFFGMRRQCTP
jgi:hypothetical protein